MTGQRIGFQLSVEGNFAVAMVLHCCALWLVKYLGSLYKPIRSKTKPNRHFSRAWRQLPEFPLSSDWFIGLSASVIIGQGDNFCFGFTALNNIENRSTMMYLRCNEVNQASLLHRENNRLANDTHACTHSLTKSTSNVNLWKHQAFNLQKRISPLP